LLDAAKIDLQTAEQELSALRAKSDERDIKLSDLQGDNIRLTETIQSQQIQISNLSARLENMELSTTELRKNLEKKDLKNEEYLQEINENIKEISQLSSENKALQEKLQTQKTEMEELGKQSRLTFESIANKIFEEKTAHFSKTSKENIAQVLDPLKQNLKEFKQKVEETYDKESKERFTLEAKIKDLVELNQQISKDANNLTKALKGEAKTQGNWGEMILESILEHSGLAKDREYVTQESYVDENGKRKQPDIVIKYPNDRHIVVDSKVSLTAYERFANCDDPELQKVYLKEHIRSIRAHIDNLSLKEYDKVEKSLDFVMLFVPVEPAYMTAIHFDQELWSYAYQKRIMLMSPTNLIAALKNGSRHLEKGISECKCFRNCRPRR
jgi:DNA recombination protein RmuC